ncbi:MAG TPA: ribonuclease J [Candidatus Anaerostipes excrementavium]|uniref:Ribonuclease J n=1 Tax=Candidatus Anaerostipes excrementavium TaxID=2838463 RepID=A0A9D2BAA4_9FIRM|nr:ribonuclease J [Candidatus Anaerostipes excrementavium]
MSLRRKDGGRTLKDNQQQQGQLVVRKKNEISTKVKRTYNNNNRNHYNQTRGRRNGAGRKKPSSVKIIPLGGLGQIGMNITAFECNNQILIVDCGLAFPDEDMLGIDLVIPDITYLKENAKKIRGLVITHGHEDHIGAIPYVEKELNVPIYATKLTMALIDNKLKEHGISERIQKNVVAHGDKVKLGIFEVEFIKTNHSIADAAALAITTPAGVIVHTGDFKIDHTPLFGEAIDLAKFAELGSKGVLALMADSTNAERQGYTLSEKNVGKRLDGIFAEHLKGRMIIATFASNVDRVQHIINSAHKYGRKVAVEGRSMVNIITTASELGYLKIPKNTLIETDQIRNYPDDQIVLITTGSQGEQMAALSRMANSTHRKISIVPTDTIIFSSSPIPGNEKNVSKIMNELAVKGAKVVFQDTHVSGHACREEIRLIYALTKPKYAIPVHGEYRHLMRHSELAEEMGIPKEKVFVLSEGDVLELNKRQGKVTGKVQAGGILVDGLGVGDVGNIVLNDRKMLSQNGLIIATVTLQRHGNQILAGPDIVSRGFVYVRESESLMEGAREVALAAVEECMERNISDWSRIKNSIKESLSNYIWKNTKRNPMILPIITEV